MSNAYISQLMHSIECISWLIKVFDCKMHGVNLKLQRMCLEL